MYRIRFDIELDELRGIILECLRVFAFTDEFIIRAKVVALIEHFADTFLGVFLLDLDGDQVLWIIRHVAFMTRGRSSTAWRKHANVFGTFHRAVIREQVLRRLVFLPDHRIFEPFVVACDEPCG